MSSSALDAISYLDAWHLTLLDRLVGYSVYSAVRGCLGIQMPLCYSSRPRKIKASEQEGKWRRPNKVCRRRRRRRLTHLLECRGRQWRRRASTAGEWGQRISTNERTAKKPPRRRRSGHLDFYSAFGSDPPILFWLACRRHSYIIGEREFPAAWVGDPS